MPVDAQTGGQNDKQEQGELQERISDWLDIPLAVLALVMLGLLILEFTVELSPGWAERVAQAETAIWIIFAIAFAIELTLAPSKLDYLKKHWLTAISVALPAFRVVRLLRIARAFRAVNLVRMVTVLNRGTRALDFIARRGQLGYVLGLATIITVAAAAAGYFFEREEPQASIRTIGDALWWATTTITTINGQLEAITFEGRVIGLILRLAGLALSGYFTAMVAVYLIGGIGRPGGIEESKADLQELRSEIKILQQQIEGWREEDRREGGQ